LLGNWRYGSADCSMSFDLNQKGEEERTVWFFFKIVLAPGSIRAEHFSNSKFPGMLTTSLFLYGDTVWSWYCFQPQIWSSLALISFNRQVFQFFFPVSRTAFNPGSVFG
jgi:hypothetical protein